MTFTGKRALWWYLVVLAILVATAFSALAAFKDPGLVSTVSATLMALTLFFVLSIQFRNDLTLEEETLLLRFGPVTKRIPYREIRSVGRTKNPISSLATSLDRISLELYDGQYLYVSARDNDRFMEELKNRRAHALRGD